MYDKIILIYDVMIYWANDDIKNVWVFNDISNNWFLFIGNILFINSSVNEFNSCSRLFKKYSRIKSLLE